MERRLAARLTQSAKTTLLTYKRVVTNGSYYCQVPGDGSPKAGATCKL